MLRLFDVRRSRRRKNRKRSKRSRKRRSRRRGQGVQVEEREVGKRKDRAPPPKKNRFSHTTRRATGGSRSPASPMFSQVPHVWTDVVNRKDKQFQ